MLKRSSFFSCTYAGRMRGERIPWITSFVLTLGCLLGRTAVLALPHEVVAVPGTTDALSLRLFVAKSELDPLTPTWVGALFSTKRTYLGRLL